MKNGIYASFAFLAIAAAVGGYSGYRSWDGVVYISTNAFNQNPGKERTPAAIRKDLDFSRLDGAELITASQKRLVTAARVILENDDLGVELGAFVTRGEDGQPQLACDFYDRLSLRFEGEGIADSGEKPVMEIEGSCGKSNDITRIEPLWIPVAKITGQRPANMDLSFHERGDVSFKFDNMPTEWPHRWSLQAVKLTSESDHSRDVNISGAELRELLPKTFMLNWKRE